MDEFSIHVYSLESGPIEVRRIQIIEAGKLRLYFQNLNVLSTCNHEVTTEYPDKDPMERWSSYGSIRNPFIQVHLFVQRIGNFWTDRLCSGELPSTRLQPQ